MRLTPGVLESAYTFLRSTLPFRRWRLPPADEIEFHVTASRDTPADERTKNGRSRIRISGEMVSHTDTLLRAMGHEMIHTYEGRLGIRTHHGAHFRKCQRLFAKHHGYDPGDC